MPLSVLLVVIAMSGAAYWQLWQWLAPLGNWAIPVHLLAHQITYLLAWRFDPRLLPAGTSKLLKMLHYVPFAVSLAAGVCALTLLLPWAWALASFHWSLLILIGLFLVLVVLPNLIHRQLGEYYHSSEMRLIAWLLLLPDLLTHLFKSLGEFIGDFLYAMAHLPTLLLTVTYLAAVLYLPPLAQVGPELHALFAAALASFSLGQEFDVPETKPEIIRQRSSLPLLVALVLGIGAMLEQPSAMMPVWAAMGYLLYRKSDYLNRLAIPDEYQPDQPKQRTQDFKQRVIDRQRRKERWEETTTLACGLARHSYLFVSSDTLKQKSLGWFYRQLYLCHRYDVLPERLEELTTSKKSPRLSRMAALLLWIMQPVTYLVILPLYAMHRWARAHRQICYAVMEKQLYVYGDTLGIAEDAV